MLCRQGARGAMRKRPRVLFVSFVCVVLLLVGGGLYSIFAPFPADQVDDIREVLIRAQLGGLAGRDVTIFVRFADSSEPDESVDPSDEFFQRLRDLNLDLRKGSESRPWPHMPKPDSPDHSMRVFVGQVKKSNLLALFLGQIWAEVEFSGAAGPLNGEGCLYRLKKVKGNWVIQGYETLWVS